VEISKLKPVSIEIIVMLLLDKVAGQNVIKSFPVTAQRLDAQLYECLCKELTKDSVARLRMPGLSHSSF
jgi:hypothetical protein